MQRYMRVENVNLEITIITVVIWGSKYLRHFWGGVLDAVVSVGKHPPLMRKTELINSYLLTTSSRRWRDGECHEYFYRDGRIHTWQSKTRWDYICLCVLLCTPSVSTHTPPRPFLLHVHKWLACLASPLMGKPVPEVVAVRQKGDTCTSFKVSTEYIKLYDEIFCFWMYVVAEINTS